MLNHAKNDGLGKTLRAHPVALVVIGVEFGWLAISATRGGNRLSEDVRERVSGASERTKALAAQLRNKVMRKSRADSSASLEPYRTESADYAYARQKSDHAMEQAKDQAPPLGAMLQDATHENRSGHYFARTGEWLSGARSRLDGSLNAYPFMTLALGFIAGAGIGLIVPHAPEKHDGARQ